MKRYAKITPEGTRDILFDECVARRNIEKKLSNLYKLRGFNRVFTPTMEYYDVFDRESAGVLAESMYKLSGGNGRLMVLRPDSTIPIARLAATRLKGMQLPLRLYYTQNVFRINPLLTGRSDEIAQSGIEMIGVKGIKADLEIINTAINALNLCGENRFRIEIGHAGFFKGLLHALIIEEEMKEELTYLFENKNYVALNELLDHIKENDIIRAIRSLPRLFGGVEILDEAERIVSVPECSEAIRYLREIYSHLVEMGMGDKISIDLGLIHRTNYYTGVLFRGYIEGSGVTVLSGGRYDRLLREFGEDLPAIGFGVEVEALTNAMLNQKDSFHERIPERLIYAELENEMKALNYLFEQNHQGVFCENSVQLSLEEAIAYATEKGIPLLDQVQEDGSVITLDLRRKEEAAK